MVPTFNILRFIIRQSAVLLGHRQTGEFKTFHGGVDSCFATVVVRFAFESGLAP